MQHLTPDEGTPDPEKSLSELFKERADDPRIVQHTQAFDEGSIDGAEFSDRVFRELLGPNWREEELSRLAEKDGTVFGYFAAHTLASDPLMQHFYRQQIFSVIERAPGVFNHLKGIHVFMNLGRKAEALQLQTQMLEKNPILGRLMFPFAYMLAKLAEIR